ncbi:hypothetical protein GIB67_020103, partial [Kingdonia uniflora]
MLGECRPAPSQSSSQSQQRAGSSNNYKGKNGGYQARSGGDQGHGQNRGGGASAGGASSSNSGREYHRPRNNGGASSSSRFQGRPGNLKCFLCGGNHKAYQCPQKTALNALMASHGDQANDTTQGNDSGETHMGSLYLLNAVTTQLPEVKPKKGLMYVDLSINGQSTS